MRILNTWRYACLALPLLFMAGCSKGERVVQVKGRVTNAGQPLHVAGRDVGLGRVQVEFVRLSEDGHLVGNREGAIADEDGRFQVYGRDGHGISPGTYRIAVRQWDPYPQLDKLDGRFTVDSSPITREVTGAEDVLIDVSRPEG
jgi:hypothetical protein